MYLIDTNVLSELRKRGTSRVDPNVVRWEQGVPAAELFLSVMTIIELEAGVLKMERRDPIQGGLFRTWLGRRVLPAFADRILPIDPTIARRAAALHIPDPQPHVDALIAATALEHRMTVVTRNTADFAPTGVPTLNPWV
jgi:predicted nucleic acid-binding protein